MAKKSLADAEEVGKEIYCEISGIISFFMVIPDNALQSIWARVFMHLNFGRYYYFFC